MSKNLNRIRFAQSFALRSALLAVALLGSLLLAPCALASADPASATVASRELKVVVTIPDLEDLVRVLGGPDIDVHAICRGKENLHYVSPRPSDLIALSKADLFCQLGLSAEATWLPSLIRRARNERIAAGTPGFVNASAGWEAIGVPGDLSRSLGDVHPEGNPHFNLHPKAGRHMAERILAGLIGVDPAGEALYRQRFAEYAAQLDLAEARWAIVGERFRGQRVVEYHQEFRYLELAYGIESFGTLEPRPGVPPTPKHLAQLVQIMRENQVEVVLTAAWSNNRFVEELAAKADATAVLLPNLVEQGGSWIAMMDEVHRALARAFGVDASELEPPAAQRNDQRESE